MKNFILISLFFLLHPGYSVAQFTMSAETAGIISTGQTPFWIQSNRSGRIARNGSHALFRFFAENRYEHGEHADLTFGADLIARPGDESTFSFNQAYLKLNAYGIELAGGRFHSTSPIHDEEVGMGSLGVSGNATPVPQIRLSLPEWTAIPFTYDMIKIRAHLAHGWLGSRRFTEDVLYHEKMGHARLGGDFPLNLYGGIAHYAIWGGKNNPRFGDLPSSLSDFGRVFIVVGGDESAPYGEAAYMLGDHKGAWDFGFFLELDQVHITGYRQFPLETKNNLKFKSPQDALTGISLKFPGSNRMISLRALTYEYLFTLWQNGPLEPSVVPGRRDEFQGNENYYNHTIYQSGWVYNRRTIGNPLFIPRENNRGVSNNGIEAHHVGIALTVGDTELKTRATVSENHGIQRLRPFGIYPELPEWQQWTFTPPKRQWSFGIVSQTPFRFRDQKFRFLFELAWDNGSLVGDQFGTLIGFRWMR